MSTFSGKRVTVMGLGLFGGGRGAVQYLLDQGARVTVTDLRSAEQLRPALAEIDINQLEGLVLEEHREADFLHTDLIVVNPAVKQQENPFLKVAREAGIALTSEINLFWQACRARKIVVTGSVGKSTTATLIQQCLVAAGLKASLGGNIGISLLPIVEEMTADDFVVLELSSFQLADLDRLQPQPDLAVITNFFPNHLDWHETLEHYRESKQAAIRWQTMEQIAVLNGDDADSALWPTDARVIWFGREVWRDQPGVHISDAGIAVRSAVGGWQIESVDLAPCLRNPHGLANVAAALGAVVVGLEIPVDRIASALHDYQALPHRFEFVAELDGRTFINDSKATTPQSTVAALQSTSQPVLLIAGGKDKGVDLSELGKAISARVKGVALIGDTAEKLRQEITVPAERVSDPETFVFQADSLAEAVRWTWQQSAPGDTILLSPGCASHAEFANYEQRGERFVEYVEEGTGNREQGRA